MTNIKVKTLVWRVDGMSSSIVGQYSVWRSPSKSGWRLMCPSNNLNVQRFETEDEAQAAAQADYERRIMSAIEIEETE